MEVYFSNAAKELVAFLAKLLPIDGTCCYPRLLRCSRCNSYEKKEKNIALLQVSDPLETSGAKKTIGIHDFYTMTGIWLVLGISAMMSGSLSKENIAILFLAKLQ